MLPTPVTIDEFELLQPTLPSGRIVELTGPESVLEGGELLLTCLVSPVVQQVSAPPAEGVVDEQNLIF